MIPHIRHAGRWFGALLAMLPLITADAGAQALYDRRSYLGGAMPELAITDEETGLPFCVPNITDNLDQVVAVLDGQQITIRDIDAEMMRRKVYAPLVDEALQDPLVLSELRPKVLEALIGMKLLRAVALRSDAIDERLVKSRAANRNQARQAEEGVIQRSDKKSLIGSALEDAQTEDDVRVDLYLEQLYKPVTVTDDEVVKAFNKAVYLARKATVVRASVILINVADDAKPEAVAAAQKKAQSVYEEALKPENSFSQLAFKNSEHESAQGAGYLGEVAPGEYGIEFERAIRYLKSGEISPPVRTLRGYTIIKMVERKGPEVPLFENVREAIHTTLLQNKRYAIMTNEILNLASRSDIQVRLYGFKLGA
jgi:parvulin-like peptidyl-prolyl isomerase